MKKVRNLGHRVHEDEVEEQLDEGDLLVVGLDNGNDHG